MEKRGLSDSKPGFPGPRSRSSESRRPLTSHLSNSLLLTHRGPCRPPCPPTPPPPSKASNPEAAPAPQLSQRPWSPLPASLLRTLSSAASSLLEFVSHSSLSGSPRREVGHTSCLLCTLLRAEATPVPSCCPERGLPADW